MVEAPQRDARATYPNSQRRGHRAHESTSTSVARVRERADERVRERARGEQRATRRNSSRRRDAQAHTETDTEERKNQKSPKIEVCPRDVLQYSSARWSFWLVLFPLLFSLLLPACCSLLAVGYVSLVRWLVARGLWLGGRLLVHDAQHITEYLVWITFSPSFG